jgi:hypothetical protein
LKNLETWKPISDIVVSWVTALGVISAVVFGMNKYNSALSAQVSDKDLATLTFIERYNGSDMLKTRRNLQGTIDHLVTELDVTLNDAINLDHVMFLGPNFYKERIVEQLRADGTFEDARHIIRFFDEVWICIDLELCNHKSAERFFTDEAYRYYYVLEQQIKDFRRTSPDFGEGLGMLRNKNANDED